MAGEPVIDGESEVREPLRNAPLGFPRWLALEAASKPPLDDSPLHTPARRTRRL